MYKSLAEEIARDVENLHYLASRVKNIPTNTALMKASAIILQLFHKVYKHVALKYGNAFVPPAYDSADLKAAYPYAYNILTTKDKDERIAYIKKLLEAFAYYFENFSELGVKDERFFHFAEFARVAAKIYAILDPIRVEEGS